MNTDWFNQPGLERLPEFLTALAIGLLIGLERERNPAAKAGLRTFALVALAGAAAATLAGVLEAPSIIAANLVLLVRLTVLASPAPASSASAPLSSSPAPAELSMPDIKNPAELHTALGFAALYAVVLLLTAWLVDVAGSRGAYLAALVSGLTDVDAITLSSLQLYGMGSLSSTNVAVSVVLAVAANSVFKLGVVWFAGSAGLFRRCAPVMCAAVMAAGVALWFFA